MCPSLLPTRLLAKHLTHTVQQQSFHDQIITAMQQITCQQNAEMSLHSIDSLLRILLMQTTLMTMGLTRQHLLQTLPTLARICFHQKWKLAFSAYQMQRKKKTQTLLELLKSSQVTSHVALALNHGSQDDLLHLNPLGQPRRSLLSKHSSVTLNYLVTMVPAIGRQKFTKASLTTE